MPSYSSVYFLYVCNLSSKSLLYSDIRYPKYLKSVTCSSKNTQTHNFIKIHPGRAKLLFRGRQTDSRTDGQTGMTNLIFAFSQFCELAWKQTWLDWRTLECRPLDLLLLVHFNSGLFSSTSNTVNVPISCHLVQDIFNLLHHSVYSRLPER